jgi:hypothetical protein
LIRQVTIPFGVLGEISVEQVHGHDAVRHAAHVELPSPQSHRAPLDNYREARVQFLEKLLDPPLVWLFRLPAARVAFLTEVTFAVQQCDADHRQRTIRRRA